MPFIRGVPGYAYNQMLGSAEHPDNENAPPRPDSDIVHPATTVAVSEAHPSDEMLLGPDRCALVECTNFDANPGFNRHSKGANYLFCDGHVKWYPVGVVRYSQVLGGSGSEQWKLCEQGSAECINGVNDGIHPTFALRPVGTPRKVFP